MSELAWPVAKIRSTFIDYFSERRGHTFVATSPVVPLRDPTLLFTNAGMNQFKDLFLGTADPNTDFGRLKRAANSQLCIRAGGKHNDLEDVGRDTYHHTFFEMLGNWSFGDYFKKEAIDWAWELLTEVYKVPKDRLYVTYFEGNPAQGLEPDVETHDLWLRHVPEDHIIKGNMKDNFWEMGDTGPCGPCTEIHYDHVGGRNARDLVNHDDPLVVEIWNLVLIQYNRGPSGELTKLPCPHVDTGMGLERITAVLQKKTSNYDTDAWLPLFDAIQRVVKYPYSYTECQQGAPNGADGIFGYRVIADHVRCLVVALSDGAMPDSIGRGFVLRRMIRRAVRVGIQFMGAEVGFFSELVPAVAASLGKFFPHIADERNLRRVAAILHDEEVGFSKTWKNGLKHFETAKAAAVDKVISGHDAFVLHDRYGFPLDLTVLLAEREGLAVDTAEFHHEMQTNQTSGGRVAAAKTFFDTYQVDQLNKDGIPVTRDDAKYAWELTRGAVMAIFDKKAEKFVESVSAGASDEDETVGIVLDSTAFYAESGGQLYDTGSLSSSTGTFRVQRVYSYGGYIVHIGRMAEGTLSVKSTVDELVNYERRLPIAVNHTCTHQLNHALRDVLQLENPEPIMDVNQRGSWVGEDYLRFDFSWNAKLSEDELKRVEAKVAQRIAERAQVYSKTVPLKEAMEIGSLRCMFDEKYGDNVNVVAIGVPVEKLLAEPKNPEWMQYSVELCGGTHISSFDAVQTAVIVSEESLMKGVRRIVVLTRQNARNAIKQADNDVKALEALRSDDAMDVNDKLKALAVLAKRVNDSAIPLIRKLQLREAIDNEIKLSNVAKKHLGAKLKADGAALGAHLAAGSPADQTAFVFEATPLSADRDALQACAEAFIQARPNAAVMLLSVDAKGDKGLALAVLSPALVSSGKSAVAWAQAACFGKGGGKPANAQTGFPPEKVAECVAAAKSFAATFA